MIRIEPQDGIGVFLVGRDEPSQWITPGDVVEVDSEDAFSGRLTSVDGKPRELAPFPFVNPLCGPIGITGARAGDLLAVHLIDVSPRREWGVSTISPNFGTLSGTRLSPNLQEPTAERVWIWNVDATSGTVATPTPSGHELRVPLRPFVGTLAVAPAHGEVRTTVVPDAHGGNLDLPAVTSGRTVYIPVFRDGAHLYVGDGHLAQGDGEFAGTAVEGACRTTLVTEVIPGGGTIPWPRIESDDELIAVGFGRPLEEACRVAVHALTEWAADISGLSHLDAYQLISQACSARIGNLVNPTYTVTVAIAKNLLPGVAATESAHTRLRRLTEGTGS